jgi:hypothetical protein
VPRKAKESQSIIRAKENHPLKEKAKESLKEKARDYLNEN